MPHFIAFFRQNTNLAQFMTHFIYVEANLTQECRSTIYI